MKLLKALTCEFLGTAFLLATVVGSGALGHKLDAGNVAVTVLCVSVATGCVLSALITMFGPISAHFNPIVTALNLAKKALTPVEAASYIATQCLGASAGVVIANLMFDLPPVVLGQTARTGNGQWLGEVVATFGLLMVIQGCEKARQEALPFLVSAYVTGAILFTSSTCFANPAVTISRTLTNTITGIRPDDVLAFLAAQSIGALAAYFLGGWLFAERKEEPIIREHTTFILDGAAKDFYDNQKEAALTGSSRN